MGDEIVERLGRVLEVENNQAEFRVREEHGWVRKGRGYANSVLAMKQTTEKLYGKDAWQSEQRRIMENGGRIWSKKSCKVYNGLYEGSR